jgi:SAM-dependent methyltransferase
LCGGSLDPVQGFSRGERRFARCRSCDAYATIPLPDPIQVERIHREQYFTQFSDAEADPRRQAMLRRLMDRIPRRPPGRLLDAGCGGGHLLALAREAGWEVTGVDPSVDACRFGQRTYGLAVEPAGLEKANLPGAAFAVITLVNVLDQAPEPAALLRTACRLLAPGGLLAVRGPNGDFHRLAGSLIRCLPSRLRGALEPLVIFHAVSLNRRALTGLLQGARLTQLRVIAAPLSGSALPGHRPGAIRLLWTALRSAGSAPAGTALAFIPGGARWSPSLLAFGERGAD